MSAPNLSNIKAVAADSHTALTDPDKGPADHVAFAKLQSDLVAAEPKMSPLYRTTFVDPYRNALSSAGASGFKKILDDDPDREGLGGIFTDAAHAILQNASGFESKALDAFQEVVSDLYDGFLSAEDRRGVEPPDKGAIAPLVKFGAPDSGPYTFDVDAMREVGCGAGVVSLPPSHARGALAGWAALGHETGGHDILGADTGLQAQLATAVQNAVKKATRSQKLARYWASRIDETAADVLGILNMGPAAGIGLVAYFRGFDSSLTLRSDGPDDDPHPADVARGFLAAEVVRLLEFSDANAWANAIAAETQKDVTKIRLSNVAVSVAQAKSMAKAIAKAIVETPLPAIENASLGEIQNWRDTDETTVAAIRSALKSGTALSAAAKSGFFAAHVVAAGVTLALSTPGISIPQIFDRMLNALKAMHDVNPSFGPLFIRHPGTLHVHRAYVRHASPAPRPQRTRARK